MHKLRRTNVIEVNRWAKVAIKTANINVQNRSLYAIVNGVITRQKQCPWWLYEKLTTLRMPIYEKIAVTMQRFFEHPVEI